MLVAYGIGALEKAFANQIKVQKYVLSALRESLKDRHDWQSYIEHVYSWSYETLLLVPGINVVICVVSSIFGSPLDRLWAEKKFDLLVSILEQQLKEPQGITWTPPVIAQPKDNTVPTISHYCRDLAFCAEQGELISAHVCDMQISWISMTGAPAGKGKKIIWMPDPLGTLEGTMTEQILPGGRIINALFKGKKLFCLDWKKISQQPFYESIVEQIVKEAKDQKEKVLLFISNPSLFPPEIIKKIHGMLNGTFYVFAIETQDVREPLSLKENYSFVRGVVTREGMQAVILKNFLPRLESQHHLYIEDQVVKGLFLENLVHAPPSQEWIEKIEQLIKEHKFTPSSDDKRLSKFLDILIRIRNRASDTDKAVWDQKVQTTARRFSSNLKPTATATQLSKLSSKEKPKENAAVLNPHQSASTISSNLDPEFPVLSMYCKDLTSEENLPPFVGRSKEIVQIAEVLEREKKNAPVLLGVPGAGKIAIIQGIAGKIRKKSPDLPSVFQRKKIFLLKDTEILANAVRRKVGAAPILAQILQEAEANKGTVLLIFENLEGFCGNDETDTIQMRHLIVSALDNQLIDCIATSTSADYSRMVRKHPALGQQFSSVKIDPLSDTELKEILSVAIPWLSIRHAVGFDDRIGDECVKLARKYLKNEPFPAIVMDILDQAAGQHKVKHPPIKEDQELSLELQSQSYDSKNVAKFSQTISVDVLYPIFFQRTGVSLGVLNQSDKELLKNLDKKISARIIGQQEAIKNVCDGIRVARFKTGTSGSMAVFLFLGTTGVGKTETVKILAELLYGSSDKMLRLDMAEYQQEIDKTKLIGAAPGYVGHDRGGSLTNWLKENPFSIVLFDEIEKAHPTIHQMLLGLFDAGRITDGHQNTLECPDAVCVMTSNLGADEIFKYQNSGEKDMASLKQTITPILAKNSGEKDMASLKQTITPILAKKFAPEFIGRIRTTAIFRCLDEENARQITELQLKAIQNTCKTNPRYLEIEFTWTPEVVSFFAKNHYDPTKGGRGIGTAVKDKIETPFINGIVEESIKKGNKVFFVVESDKIAMKVN